MPKPRPRPAPAACPDCAEPLSLGGRFCKTCGWDADTAGSGDADLDGVDLPQGYAPEDESAFDYDETLRREGLRGLPRGRRLFWVAAAAVALIAFVLAFVL